MDTLVEIRELRRRAGMTQGALAARAGLAQSVLSAYENGKRAIPVEVFVRLADAADATVLVRTRPRHTLVGLPALLDAVVDGSPAGDRDGFRIVCEFLAAAVKADRFDAVAMINDEPAPVAPKWDALLGAVAEDVAARHALPVPSWSVSPGRFVEPWWFVSPYKSQQAHAFATASGPYKARGVFVAPESLESM